MYSWTMCSTSTFVAVINISSAAVKVRAKGSVARKMRQGRLLIITQEPRLFCDICYEVIFATH